MKKDLRDEMSRWRDRAPHGVEAEDRAADLIRGSLAPGQPDSVRLLRVEQALGFRRQRRPSWPLGSLLASPGVLRVVLVAVALIVCVASVRAYELARRAGWLKRSEAVVPASSSPSAPSRRAAHVSRLRPVAEGLGGAVTAEQSESSVSSTMSTADVAAGATAVSVTRDPAWSRPSVAGQASGHVPDDEALARDARNAHSRRHATDEQRTRPDGWSDRRTGGPDLARLPTGGARPLDLAMAPAAVARSGASGAASAHSIVPQAAPVVRFEAPAGLSAPPPTVSRPPASPAQASLPQSPSDEVRTLDHALALLRREHDGVRALSALDAYLGRYPNGLLSREARFARVDALLMLGRSADALAALDGLQLDRGRRSTELQVIRGELRAQRDCLGAEADFSIALAQSPNAGLLGRILYGRGVCRMRLGNVAGAVSDLERYLDRFPTGVHASSARQWLQSAGRASRPQNQP